LLIHITLETAPNEMELTRQSTTWLPQADLIFALGEMRARLQAKYNMVALK